jgi:hypothetical protein
MVPARSRKSLSVEEIMVKTCTDALSDGPSDKLGDSESYSDTGPEIARNIKKTVCHLSSDSESGSA